MSKIKSKQQKKVIQDRQKRNRARKADNRRAILSRDFSEMWAYPQWEIDKFGAAVMSMRKMVKKLDRRELLFKRFKL